MDRVNIRTEDDSYIYTIQSQDGEVEVAITPICKTDCVVTIMKERSDDHITMTLDQFIQIKQIANVVANNEIEWKRVNKPSLFRSFRLWVGVIIAHMLLLCMILTAGTWIVLYKFFSKIKRLITKK